MRPKRRSWRSRRREPSALDKYDPLGVRQMVRDPRTGKVSWVLTPHGLVHDKSALMMRLMDALSPAARDLLTENDIQTAFNKAPQDIALELFRFDEAKRQGMAILARKYKEIWDNGGVVGPDGISGDLYPDTGNRT